MINEMGANGLGTARDKIHAFIEGESDIIDEDDENNNSFDEIKRKTITHKKNKSLDDFDGELNEQPVN